MRIVDALRGADVPADAIATYESVREAFDAAHNDANDTDRIAAFGSFLTVAAALEAARTVR